MHYRIKKEGNNTLIHVRISEKQMQNLKKIAQQLQCSYSYVINMLLSDFVISRLFKDVEKIGPYSTVMYLEELEEEKTVKEDVKEKVESGFNEDLNDFYQRDDIEKSENPIYITDNKVKIIW